MVGLVESKGWLQDLQDLQEQSSAFQIVSQV